MTTPPRLRPQRSRAGFALYSALAVVLLFAFAVSFVFVFIREGDRRVERRKGDRQALDLAESAVAVMIRRFELSGATGELPAVEIAGGKARGEMTSIGDNRWRIRAIGEVPVPGGEESRSAIVVEGWGQPGVPPFQVGSWRWGRGEERK